MFKRTILLAASLVVVLAIMPTAAFAVTAGENVKFNIDANLDAAAREQVSATLVKTSSNLYFYVDKTWWEDQPSNGKNDILANFDALSAEFSGKIYPKLTSIFGNEWNPGVDGDSKITILFHPLKGGSAGYFRSADEYLKLQIPASNEREMLYMSTNYIQSPQLKIFVAHEFTHLIAFNQKDRLQGVQEEVWLNEARADYTSTLLGYDDVYEGSNLQKRVRDFLSSPSDSLTEWKETRYDYAVASLFTHYLVDHYSIGVLADSLKSKSVGIASLNAALVKSGATEDFSKIFTNWTIAILINDCSKDTLHCYVGQHLTSLRISPTLNFLPLSGNSSLSVSNVFKNWSGNWQKIIGGNGSLKLDFESLAGLKIQVPYLLVDKNNAYTLQFLKLDSKQKGQIIVPDFGEQFSSLIIVPSLQSKMSDFGDFEFTYPYTFTTTITGAVPGEDQQLILQLLAKIEELKKQIAELEALRGNGACSITVNLYVGVQQNAQVTCLQKFLVSQGSAIYPEALVTGNFASLTRAAVVRFQGANGIAATGFVGPITRSKINALMPK